MRMIFQEFSLDPDRIRDGGEVFDIVSKVMTMGEELGMVVKLTTWIIGNWSNVLQWLKSGLDSTMAYIESMFEKVSGLFGSIWEWLVSLVRPS